MTPKTFYRFQYNTGQLSMNVADSKETIYACAKYLTQKKHYPICIWIIKQKKENA